MKTVLTILCLIASCVIQMNAIEVTIPTRNKLTKRYMPVRIDVYNAADTTFIARAPMSIFSYRGENRVSIILDKKNYILHLIPQRLTDEEIAGGAQTTQSEDNEAFEAEWLTLDLTEETADNLTLPAVDFAPRRLKKLNEVTVTASRVMFYHKGDTLVYNASAFLLADGSMLDALIKQLPGVELRSNGIIYCNGRRVNDLLLNGRDIFNGKNELMLENIAAYTVKNIQVYDKTGALSDLIGEKLKQDTRYVMDVKLKKEYQIGGLINADAGYGTENRYLARIFGMWYNENLALTAYANLNNLSDKRKPGTSDTSWSRASMPGGVSTAKTGGMTYNIKGAPNTWEAKGSADVTHTTDIADRFSIRQNYLPGGDTWEYRWQTSRNRELKISTNHQIQVNSISRVLLHIMPDFTYSNIHNTVNNLSAAFSEEISDITRDRVEAIYTSGGAGLLKYMINRNKQDKLTNGRTTEGSLRIPITISLKRSGLKNWVTLDITGKFSTRDRDNFDRYTLNNGNGNRPEQFKYQYTRLHPSKNSSLSALVKFNQILEKRHKMTSGLRYNLSMSRSNERSDLYMLSDLAGAESWEIGVLPSAAEYEPTYSPALSQGEHTRRTVHSIATWLDEEVGHKVKGSFNLFFFLNKLGLDISDSRYEYVSDNRRQNFTRRAVHPNVSAMIMGYMGERGNFRLNLDASPRYADMRWMVDLPQTDPLNRYMGNPDLKDGMSYNGNVRFAYSKNQQRHVATMSAGTVTDAMARGYVYDAETGVRTFRSYNVNGNWNATAGYVFSRPFGKGNRFYMSTSTGGRFDSNVDMIGSTAADGGVPSRSRVNTAAVKEVLNLSYNTGRHRLTARADLTLNRYFGNDAGFERFTSRTFNYGGVRYC